MFVKYNPKHPHVRVVPVVDGVSVAAESVILNPGTNEVSDEKWDKIKGSLEAEISAGIIKPFTVGTQKSGSAAKAKTLKDVPVTVATKIIYGCSNKDTLRTWFKESLPDELALHVVKRMRQLNMDIDAISGEVEGLSDDEIIDESKPEAGNGDAGAEKGAKETEKDSGYDGMSYAELQNAAKGKGINPSQKKEALIKALKDADNDAGAESEAGNGDSIPDFDNPDVKV